jgi:glutamate/tyrosine decarboxylase-like PLP-dependent enzyme
MNPEYLKDVLASESGEVDFRNRSAELTRRSRAIKLWLTFRTYGLQRIQAGIQRGIELAETAERIVREGAPTWELVTPAQLGIVTFALRGATKAQHDAAAQALTESGFATVTSTVLKTRSVLRLCTINPLTTEDDLRETLRRLAATL